VTSATIDAQRFADHFEQPARPGADHHGVGRACSRWRQRSPAVSKRARDYDLNDAIADAVDELWREAHNAGRHLRLPARRARDPRGSRPPAPTPEPPAAAAHAEVLPLFARLSQAEQDRIFDSHSGRRIVLATNVAETSLTVPGIRYVIDAGTARMKRYSFRSKVEQLLGGAHQPVVRQPARRALRPGGQRHLHPACTTSKISPAGRVSPTPRSCAASLAGVILRMKSLRLGAVEDFPFPGAPPGRAIADGYAAAGRAGCGGRGQ